MGSSVSISTQYSSAGLGVVLRTSISARRCVSSRLISQEVGWFVMLGGLTVECDEGRVMVDEFEAVFEVLTDFERLRSTATSYAYCDFATFGATGLEGLRIVGL
jgi:hypothetical protein